MQAFKTTAEGANNSLFSEVYVDPNADIAFKNCLSNIYALHPSALIIYIQFLPFGTDIVCTITYHKNEKVIGEGLAIFSSL